MPLSAAVFVGLTSGTDRQPTQKSVSNCRAIFSPIYILQKPSNSEEEVSHIKFWDSY